MLLFVLIASLATVVLLAWVTVIATRGGLELRATKALAGMRGVELLRIARGQARPDADRHTESEPDVELAVRERLYGQRTPRT